MHPKSVRRHWVHQLQQEREGHASRQSIDARAAENPGPRRPHQAPGNGERNLKKSHGSLDVRLDTVVAQIDHLKESYPIEVVCDVLGVNRSSYYAVLKRSQRLDPDRQRIRERLVKLHRVSRGAAGARILSQWLKAEGEQVGRYKAGRLMTEAGVASKQPSKRHRYGVLQARPDIPNRLARQFAVTAPNQVWCGDITWAGGGWIYLAVVLDLFSRRVVGWAVSANADSALSVVRWTWLTRPEVAPRMCYFIQTKAANMAAGCFGNSSGAINLSRA